jgi:16S rRNA (uracil1498-N3)-methyltransferase
VKFQDGLKLIEDYENKILFYEKSENLENHRLKEGRKVVFIGPEGGISDDEAEILKQNGFLDFSMGEYVMKADTAVICALSTVKNWTQE